MSTLRDVAQHAGVSQQTASRILNGNLQRHYRGGARERVLAAAKNLGYRPSGIAQAMRAQRMDSIGWFSASEPEFGHISGQMWSGIQHVLLQHDYNLISGSIPIEDAPPGNARLPAIVHQKLVAGLLVNFTHRIPRWIDQLLAAEKRPVVWFNVRRGQPCVYLDDENAAFQLTRHFIERGHRRIAYADYSLGSSRPLADRHYSALDRENGYARALWEAGLPARVIRPEHPLQNVDAMAYTRAWMDRPDRPTAILAYEPYHTLRPILYLMAMMGTFSPAMACFAPDVLEEGDFRIATGVVPEWALGARATELLLDHIHTGQPPAPEAGQIAIQLHGLDGIAPPPPA